MTETANQAPALPTLPTLQEVQEQWNDLLTRAGVMEAEVAALTIENHKLRQQLEKLIAHRQTSHSELVILLTTLVSKLPINDVGVLVSRLVEHNTSVTQFLNALGKGTIESHIEQPSLLKSFDQTKRELHRAIQPLVDELLKLEPPLEKDLLEALPAHPEEFFTARAVRAARGFFKGQIPRERVVRDFGEKAAAFFHDFTTDPKLNPRPKPEEIVYGFREDFEEVFKNNPNALSDKRGQLAELYRRVQISKGQSEQAQRQRNVFLRLAFIIELLHYYEHQSTENPEALFAQRLPTIVEQLILGGPQDNFDEGLLKQAEELLSHIINSDHRQMVMNNMGKTAEAGKTLKFILKLRQEKVLDEDQVVADFMRHLFPSPGAPPPPPKTLLPLLRLIHPAMQQYVVKSILTSDRIRRDQGEALAKALAGELGIKGVERARKTVPPEAERQLAWDKIRDMIRRRADPGAIADSIRDRLRAKYEADEIRESWLTLAEADPVTLIRIFSHLPYTPEGKTEPIARPVMETYVSRLMHEKYAAIYGKIVRSLRNMFHARHDSPLLVNFTALVRWVDPEAANKLCADVGMPAES